MFHRKLCLKRTYSAVFAQRSENRWQEPMEELKQKRAVVKALQLIRKSVHPGHH